MPLNFDLAGKKYDTVAATITAEQIQAYADASGDANPRYQPGPDQIASPIFPVVPAFASMMGAGADPDLGVDNPLMIVHGEQRFRYHRPIRPGDELTLKPSLESVEDKGKHGIFVTKVEITDAAGEPVVDEWATILVRGGGSGAERTAGESEAPAKGTQVAEFTSKVDVDMPRRYADASGDRNPIHLDENVARAVGLPGVINHGLGTLSLVAGGLVEQVAKGDATHLRDLDVRFTAMVIPGDELTTTVWDTAGMDGHGGGYIFATARPDGSVVIAGALTVAGG